MRNRIQLFAVALGAVLLAAGPAWPDTGPIYDRITIDQVAAILQDAGYRAKKGKTGDNSPEIESAAQGVTFWVDFFGCDEATPQLCTSISFTTVLSPTEPHSNDLLNGFNASKRYTRAYREEDGDTVLSVDIEVAGGVSKQNLANWLDWWDTQLGAFLAHVHW